MTHTIKDDEDYPFFLIKKLCGSIENRYYKHNKSCDKYLLCVDRWVCGKYHSARDTPARVELYTWGMYFFRKSWYDHGDRHRGDGSSPAELYYVDMDVKRGRVWMVCRYYRGKLIEGLMYN
jgi:hypothetical protein